MLVVNLMIFFYILEALAQEGGNYNLRVNGTPYYNGYYVIPKRQGLLSKQCHSKTTWSYYNCIFSLFSDYQGPLCKKFDAVSLLVHFYVGLMHFYTSGSYRF